MTESDKTIKTGSTMTEPSMLNDSGEMLHIIVFELVDEDTKQKGYYGISMDQIKEIRTLGSITKVPQTSSYVKGVMNLRGKIISIINTKEKLGLMSSEPKSSSHVVVAAIGDKQTGFLVDEVVQVLQVPLKNIETSIEGSWGSAPYFKGIAKDNDRLIIIIDIAKLLEHNAEESAKKIPAR